MKNVVYYRGQVCLIKHRAKRRQLLVPTGFHVVTHSEFHIQNAHMFLQAKKGPHIL